MSPDGGLTWSERYKLIASDGAAGDRFGYAVALYGSKIVATAYKNDNERGVDAGMISSMIVP